METHARTEVQKYNKHTIRQEKGISLGAGDKGNNRSPRLAVAYAISLPEEEANFMRLSRELANEGIKLNLWPGVRLKKSATDTFDDFRLRYLQEIGVIRKDKHPAVGNTGLAVAHMSLWLQLETWLPENELALVFEDDEHLKSNYKNRLLAVFKAANGPIDFINLNTLRPTGKPIKVDGFGGEDLFRVGKDPEGDPDLDSNVWLSSYAISKAGIKKLLAGLKKHQVSDNGQHGIIDHAVGKVIQDTPSILAFALTRNVISFHNETISFREGLNDGHQGPNVQFKGT